MIDISITAANVQKIYPGNIEPGFVPEIIYFKNFVGQFDEFRESTKHCNLLIFTPFAKKRD